MKVLLKEPRDISIQGSGAGKAFCLGKVKSKHGGEHTVVLTSCGMGIGMVATLRIILTFSKKAYLKQQKTRKMGISLMPI
ncbi:hypothetical protein, partial [Brevibacillus centrosporus]